MGTELLQLDGFLFLLVLLNFLIAKSLFGMNIKCLFCGEFYWMMMVIKIKIIIMFLFLIIFFNHFCNDNDDVVKGYVVKYLWQVIKMVLSFRKLLQ